MSDIREIQSELNAEPSPLREQIVRGVGGFTTALMGVAGSGPNETLHLAGTGTFVTDTKSHYILTARHVWEKKLKGSMGVGLTFTEDLDHKYFIPIKAIEVSGPTPPDKWNEWGPDLVYLKVPSEVVGTISAHKSFYRLGQPPMAQAASNDGIECIELHMLMGTPYEQGTFTDKHADLQITGMLQGISKRHDREGWDYLDLEMDLTQKEVPQDFGGVSGGGLWELLVFRLKDSKKTTWKELLEGVAFYQFDPINSTRIVRCHGANSILKGFPAV